MPTRFNRSEAFDLLALFDALEGVDYVVVGGGAAALHGAPRLTFDVDIVPAASTGNRDRLFRALTKLATCVREPGKRRLPLTKPLFAQSCAAGGQLRLQTQVGPLDILWRLRDGRGYEEIAAQSVLLSDRERQIRVVGIDELIEIKLAAGRPQDQQDVQYLKRIRKRAKTNC